MRNAELGVTAVGHSWPGALQDNHDGVLPRRDGHPARVRRHGREVVQQCVASVSLARDTQLTNKIDIRTWHANVEQHASEGVNKILIGNKCDWTDKKARICHRSVVEPRN